MEKMEASNLEVKVDWQKSNTSTNHYVSSFIQKSILLPGCNPLASKQRDVLLLGVVGEELPLGHRLVHQAPL